jgi:hypothetical protein
MFKKIKKALESFFMDSKKVNRFNAVLPVSFEPEIDPLTYVALFEPSINIDHFMRK